MKNRIKTPALLLAATLALGGCDLLDVNNPNNLVEESISSPAAASAVANGSLALVASSVSQVWQPYLVASDDVYWIGSRDAWLSLDQGFLSDPNNEFTDGAFPSMGQARWMADEAIEILQGHVSENPGEASFATNLARAYLFAGIMYMVIGEIQEDFAFSDKTEDGPPVGPNNMNSVLQTAISYLDNAVSGAQGVGDATLEQRARAVRARAQQSLAIWQAINPSPSGSGLVNATAAEADALAVIGAAGGVTADWDYNFSYSSGTVGNSMASWINDRKENQIDLSLVTVNAANDIDGIALMDPIDNIPDPALLGRLEQWKDGAFDSKGSTFSDLTVAGTRMMHLILAENGLAAGDNGKFTAHINHVRAMDGLTPYSGQVDAMDMLMHTRRVNTFMQGLRLADMYRWGLSDPQWQPQGDAILAPGTMLPITIIEIRANCYLNGLGCG
jgi:hypothetical protein